MLSPDQIPAKVNKFWPAVCVPKTPNNPTPIAPKLTKPTQHNVRDDPDADNPLQGHALHRRRRERQERRVWVEFIPLYLALGYGPLLGMTVTIYLPVDFWGFHIGLADARSYAG